jgi:hypothetical protein
MMGVLVGWASCPMETIMTNVERLEKIISSPRLRPSSKSFAESMLEQAKKKELSEKQLTYVDKFWAECFPSDDVVAEEKAWAESFTDEMKKNVQIMGEYYEKHYPTSRLAKNYKEEGWVPTKEIYEKSVASDWAKRVIGNYNTQFRFSVGEMCILRDTAKNRSTHRDNMDNPLLVLECVKNAGREFTNWYVVIDTTMMDQQKQFSIPEASVNVIKTKKG